MAGAGRVALTLLKPHQKPVECHLEAQRAALKVTRAGGGMLMRVALEKVQVWRVLPGPMLELHVTMGSSQGVLKFQNREATTEADIREIARAISEAKGVEPEEGGAAPAEAASAPGAGAGGGGGDAKGASPAPEVEVSTHQGVGPSLAAKKHRASVVAASNMLTLRKLKKEREAIEKMADPDLDPAEKERLKQAAQQAVRERKESAAQRAAPPAPAALAPMPTAEPASKPKPPPVPAAPREKPEAAEHAAPKVGAAAPPSTAQVARLERELSVSNERLKRKGAMLESAQDKLKAAEGELRTVRVELEDARTKASETSDRHSDHEDELVGELVQVRAALSDSQRTIQEQDAYLKRVEERHEYEGRENAGRLARAEDDVKRLEAQLAVQGKKSGIDEKHLLRIQELQTEAVEARRAEQESAIEARGAKETFQKLETEMNELAQEHESSVIAQKRAEERAGALEVQHDRLERTLAELLQEHQTLTEEKAEAEGDMERVSFEMRAQLEGLQEDLAARGAVEASLTARLEEKDAELRAALEECSRLEAAVKDLSDASDNGERAVEAMKREMEEKNELSRSLQAAEHDLKVKTEDLETSRAAAEESAARASRMQSALSDLQDRMGGLEGLIADTGRMVESGLADLKSELGEMAGQSAQRLDAAERTSGEVEAAAEGLGRSLEGAVARVEGLSSSFVDVQARLESVTREKEEQEASHSATASSQLRDLEEEREAHAVEVASLTEELLQWKSLLESAQAAGENLRAKHDALVEAAQGLERESADRGESLSSLQAELDTTKSTLSGEIHAANTAFEESQALLEQSRRTQETTAEFLTACLGGCDQVCSLVSAEALKVEDGLPALKEGLSALVLAVSALKNFSDETAADLESKVRTIDELNTQFADVNEELAKLHEEMNTLEDLREELARLQDIEESYNFLVPVREAVSEMSPEDIAVRLGNAEVELLKANKRMSRLEDENSDLTEQLQRSRRLIDMAAVRKESLEKELELNKRSANELRVKIEASDLQNRILKDSLEPATLATFNVSLTVDGDVEKELPAVVEVWKGGLRLHEASLPAGSITIAWDTMLGWSANTLSLTIFISGSAPTDSERQLHMTLDRRSIVQMLNAMQHCVDVAISEGSYVKPFCLRTQFGPAGAEENPPSPGLSLTTPGIDQIRGVKEELSLIQDILSSKLDQSVFRKELLESPEKAEGYVQSLEDSLAVADAMKEVLKADVVEVRRQTLDTLKRLHASLVLFLALGSDREDDKSAALADMGTVIERHLEQQKAALLPGGGRASEMPPQAVVQLERLWKTRLADLEGSLRKAQAAREALQVAHDERGAALAELESRLDKHLQDKSDRETRDAGAARLNEAAKLVQGRERPVGAALSALEAQLEALRQDNTVLAELLRDSRETFTAQFQREAGEVNTLRLRALAPLLSGQPAEEDELNDIVQMLGAAPALREVPAEALRDLARYARFHEYAAGEEVRQPGGGSVGIALVTEGALQETAPAAGAGPHSPRCLQVFEAGSQVLPSLSLADGAWRTGLRCSRDASVFWVGAFELGIWLDRHGGLRATVGPALGDVPGAEAADAAAVATTGRIETPRGPRALGALVLELQERLHASEREKASLRRDVSELQAEACGLQEQVKVQRGLKSAAQQQAHPRNQSTRLERLEHAMRAGKAVIQATPARAPQAERRLTVAELDLEELPSLAPPPESPPASRGDSGEVGGGGARVGSLRWAGGLPVPASPRDGQRVTSASSTGAVYGLSGPRAPAPVPRSEGTPASAGEATPAAGSSWAAGSPFVPISGERPIQHQLREARGQIAQLSAGTGGWPSPAYSPSASVSGSAAPAAGARGPAGGAASRRDKLDRVCKSILQAVNR